jgi:hypothetical protein
LESARLADEEGRLTPEQRDLLRKQIDARVRERLSERGERRIASPGGYAPKPPKPTKP